MYFILVISIHEIVLWWENRISQSSIWKEWKTQKTHLIIYVHVANSVHVLNMLIHSYFIYSFQFVFLCKESFAQ